MLSSYDPDIFDSVSYALVVFSTLLAPIILPYLLLQCFLSTTECLVVGHFICSCQLLDEASLMMIMLGSGQSVSIAEYH